MVPVPPHPDNQPPQPYQRQQPHPQPHLTRRSLLGLGLATAAAPVLAACSGASTSGSASGAGTVNFLCTQFTPIQERQNFQQILKSRAGKIKVAFNPVDSGVFGATVKSQEQAHKVQISLLGGLHGDLTPYQDDLESLDSLSSSLSGRGFPAAIAQLGRMGGSSVRYIPWMQASYIFAAKKTMLQYLPSGANVNSLTYDQLLTWVTNARKANRNKPVFGLPCGPKGLYHRFFEGYLLPSFTGTQITGFRSPEAVTAWQYMKELWAQTAPASTNYNFMQEPLQTGEVSIAWDHVARLVDAPGNAPQDWVMMPAPTGPKGLGYMLVVAGLAIPKGAPDSTAAQDLIKVLTEPATQGDVLVKNAFFPVVTGGVPASLSGAIALEAGAVDAQSKAPNAVVALPPVGLGTYDGQLSKVFQDTFTEICLNNKPIQQVLDAQATQVNNVLKQANVPCWPPDPSSNGAVCQVQ